jgi:hypothetical protein
MGRRRVGSVSRSAGPARAFLLTLAVGLVVGLLLGFFLGRIGGGNREQAAPPTPPARTVTVEKTVVPAPEKTVVPAEKTALETTATGGTPSASASVSP